MSSRDRYAHLRANLELHREATAHRSFTWWCTECQLHEADKSGLCPLCRPDEATGPVAEVAEPAA
jgi:hypothetical protein